MAAQNPVTLSELTDELLNRGRSQGFLSTEEVAGLVQEGDLSATEVEEFYVALEEEEITLGSGEGAEGGGGGGARGARGRAGRGRGRGSRAPRAGAPGRRRAAGSPPPCRSPRRRRPRSRTP